MTSDERAQLIEDIQRAAKVRRRIVAQARLDKAFDIAAAWEELEALDQSINQRVIKSRLTKYLRIAPRWHMLTHGGASSLFATIHSTLCLAATHASPFP